MGAQWPNLPPGHRTDRERPEKLQEPRAGIANGAASTVLLGIHDLLDGRVRRLLLFELHEDHGPLRRVVYLPAGCGGRLGLLLRRLLQRQLRRRL